MDLNSYVGRLREEMANAAELGGPDTRALAERLTTTLESAFRLALQDALSLAADDLTRELAPGAVELRLRLGQIDFVYFPPMHEDEAPGVAPSDTNVAPSAAPESDDGAMSRINFRLPDQLKGRIEEAAARDGLSVNAWLVRATTTAVQESARPRTSPSTPISGQRYTGWAR